MTFNEPEMIELGAAEKLIEDMPGLPNTEGTDPARNYNSLPAYVADTE